MLRRIIAAVFLLTSLAVPAMAANPTSPHIDFGMICTEATRCVFICKNGEVIDATASPDVLMVTYLVMFGLMTPDEFIQEIVNLNPKNEPMAKNFVTKCLTESHI